MKTWVKRPQISINDKNFQNLGLKEIGKLNVSILNDFFIISNRDFDVTIG